MKSSDASCPSCAASVPTQATYCPSCGMRIGVATLNQVYAGALSKTHAAVLVQDQLIGGRYRVESPIASGAMGEVWRGRDEHLHGRPCAIKVVLFAGATAEQRAERATWFAREAEVLSRLHHPAICDIRDVISDGCAQYMVLELIEGRTLADELAARGGPGLPAQEVLSWAATLCDALTYLHSQTPPITFRDLKPQNVMLRPDGRVALIDFGIARAMAATGGTAIGTGGYAPPEQYQGLADARSDVYGLAATLHHLLTGRDPTRHPPFVFPPVRSLVPTLHSHVETVLMRALSIAPDDRFPTASAFVTGLSTVPTSAPLTARTSQGMTRHVQSVLQTVNRLDALIAEARQTHAGLPHVLLVGPAPPGMLLRHIAEAIALDLGVTIRSVNSRDVTHMGDLAAILTNGQADDIVYMDDVNALAPPIRNMLRDAMVEYEVDFVIGKGASARTLKLELQRITVIGGVPSRRALTSEAASYFAEHIDARSLDSAWTASVARVRASATTSTLGEPTTQESGGMPAADDGESENEDLLLSEATRVVCEYRRASVSLLQRRLSIGYGRAARLLDQLEERGIVGPSEDGRSRVVLDPENENAECDHAQDRAGRANAERDAAQERATRAVAERDEAPAKVRAHAERRGWLARLLRH